jgi:DNA-binding GntR family transcriptional regulator
MAARGALRPVASAAVIGGDEVTARGRRAQSLWESVAAGVRELIMSGELPAGTRLVERDLADRFVTSQGPVRTALKELERTGLVTIAPRRGAYVASLAAEDVDEIFLLIEALWSVGARRAVTRMRPADAEHLRALLDDCERTTTAWEITRASLRFHRAVMQLADLPRLLLFWDALQTQAQFQALAVALTAADLQLPNHPLRNDRKIYAALARGDAEAAIRIMSATVPKFRAVLAADYSVGPGADTGPAREDTEARHAYQERRT